MILDIAVMLIAFANLLMAISLYINIVSKPTHNISIPNPIVKIRKKKKDEVMTQDEILLRNIEAYDGTDSGQMEI